ncbi:MAG: NADPH:quinone reductase [Janthinobacterium lividum]
MKAIRVHEFGGPEVLRLEDINDPEPGPGQILVKLEAVGVNPVDVYVHTGGYGQRPLPYTPGSDAAGIIEAIGEGVTGFQIGGRVFTAGTITGAYAEKTLCRPNQVQFLPERLSFAQGAAIHVPYYTAYYALHLRAKASPGETLLVHGASGGVGLAAVQIAHALGMTVIGTAGSEKGRELVAAQGAEHVLDHTKDGYLDEIKALTGGKGTDVILEMLANVNLGKDLGFVAQNGRVVVVGNRGSVEIDPRLTMQRNSTILGMSLMNATEADLSLLHAALGAGFGSGTLTPVIAREFPLADAPQAHKAIMEPGASGKIVLIP